eukprot:gene13793-13914_t
MQRGRGGRGGDFAGPGGGMMGLGPGAMAHMAAAGGPGGPAGGGRGVMGLPLAAMAGPGGAGGMMAGPPAMMGPGQLVMMPPGAMMAVAAPMPGGPIVMMPPRPPLPQGMPMMAGPPGGFGGPAPQPPPPAGHMDRQGTQVDLRSPGAPERPGSAGSAGADPGPAVAPMDLPGYNRPTKRQQRSNDYCQHFVDTGERPQNFLRDTVLEDRYADYPQLQRLIQLKNQQVDSYRMPPYALRADLRRLKLSKELFGTRFDVILIDPPWEEYVRRAPRFVSDPETWTWQDIQNLDIDAIADTPSFVFLWCGSAEGLDAGRHCLRKWGFRRSEDICWIKTNLEHKSRKYLIPTNQEQGSMLVHTKEHCLMGIRGIVKRSHDGHLIHTNVDTDIIITEEPPLGSTEKPEELYSIIERFCAGRRRLELFGEDRNIRPGWVTVGWSITQTTFKKQLYSQHFRDDAGVPYDEHRGTKPPAGAPVLVPSTAEIEELRPRSPPHFSAQHGRAPGR